MAKRPGAGDEDMRQLLPVAIKDDFCYDERSLKLQHKSGQELVFITETSLDISSTMIRDRIVNGEPVDAYIPQPVAGYIEEHNLYRRNERSYR